MLGKPVITGPYVQTIEFPFAEAEAAGVAIKAMGGEDLTRLLVANHQPDPAAIAAFVASQVQATDRTLAAIPRLLAAVRPF